MSATHVKRTLSSRSPETLEDVIEMMTQEVMPVLQECRDTINRFVSGPYDLGTIMSGSGVPTAAPTGARAIYIRLNGGALTSLYVYEGPGPGWVAK